MAFRLMLKAKCLLNSVISKEVKTSRSVWNSVASRCGWQDLCLAKGTRDKGRHPLVWSPADGKRSAALVRLQRKLRNNREIGSWGGVYCVHKISELLCWYFCKIIIYQTKLLHFSLSRYCFAAYCLVLSIHQLRGLWNFHLGTRTREGKKRKPDIFHNSALLMKSCEAQNIQDGW